MANDSTKGGFWSTVPGILTGLAALIGACTALYVAFKPVPQPNRPDPGVVMPTPRPTPVPTPVPRPTPVVYGPMGPLERGISYNQGDIYDRPSSSPEQCSQLCYNDNRCRAMTFIISQQRCWIKDRVLATAQSSDMVSAVKQRQ